MAAMATGFEWAVRARAKAAQAATIPAICIVFPTAIGRRLKSLRCKGEFEVFIFAAYSRGSHSRSERVSRVTNDLRSYESNLVSSNAGSVLGNIPKE